jgi:hypothetical protein
LAAQVEVVAELDREMWTRVEVGGKEGDVEVVVGLGREDTGEGRGGRRAREGIHRWRRKEVAEGARSLEQRGHRREGGGGVSERTRGKEEGRG